MQVEGDLHRKGAADNTTLQGYISVRDHCKLYPMPNKAQPSASRYGEGCSSATGSTRHIAAVAVSHVLVESRRSQAQNMPRSRRHQCRFQCRAYRFRCRFRCRTAGRHWEPLSLRVQTSARFVLPRTPQGFDAPEQRPRVSPIVPDCL